MKCPIIDRRWDGGFENVFRVYELSARCKVCGEPHIAIFQKGCAPTPADDVCPHCEIVGTIGYGTTEYAGTLRKLHSLDSAPAGSDESEPPADTASLAPVPPAPTIAPSGLKIYDDGKGPYLPGSDGDEFRWSPE